MKKGCLMTSDMCALAQDLLDRLKASRVTIRLDVRPFNFPVVAEALAGGVRPLMGVNSLDQRNLATVRWLMDKRVILVQEDLANAQPQAPAALISEYGVSAQMLAPLLFGGDVFGWISVHDCNGPRIWRSTDRDALSKAAESLSKSLGGE